MSDVIYVERDNVVYVNIGMQGPAGAPGPSLVILPPTDPISGGGILIRNGANGVQDSGKIFNDSGATDGDIWSAEKVLSYTGTLLVDGGTF